MALLLLAVAARGADPADPSDASDPSPAPVVHTVAAGESICSIAGSHGVDPAALRSRNQVEPVAEPEPGSVLEIPSGHPLTYRVREGDTLTSIATWSGLSLAKLVRANQLSDPDRLSVGAALRLPQGGRTGCPPERRRARVRSPVPEAQPPEPAAEPPRADADLQVALRVADARLVLAEHYYEIGDYLGALSEVDSIAGSLEGWDADARAREMHARGEILAGVSQVGLGDRKQAIQRFASAQQWDPGASLDPRQHAPKVLELWEEAQGRAAR